MTGLAFEARDLVAGWGAGAPAPRTALGVGAAAATEAVLAAGARGVVSFGLAGGLAAALAPGTVVVASAVGDDERVWRLAGAGAVARGLGAVAGVLYTAGSPLSTVAAKRAVAARSGAVAVDMESAHVVATAARAGARALVVRVVADPAARPLPRLAAVAAAPDGRLDRSAIARALLARPADWPLVILGAVDTARARAGLRRAAAGLAGLARQGLVERLLDVPLEDVGGRPLV